MHGYCSTCAFIHNCTPIDVGVFFTKMCKISYFLYFARLCKNWCGYSYMTNHSFILHLQLICLCKITWSIIHLDLFLDFKPVPEQSSLSDYKSHSTGAQITTSNNRLPFPFSNLVSFFFFCLGGGGVGGVVEGRTDLVSFSKHDISF